MAAAFRINGMNFGVFRKSLQGSHQAQQY